MAPSPPSMPVRKVMSSAVAGAFVTAALWLLVLRRRYERARALEVAVGRRLRPIVPGVCCPGSGEREPAGGPGAWGSGRDDE